MGFLDFFKKKNSIAGYIGYFELQDWWLEIFSQQEHMYIQKKYQPMGNSDGKLTTEKITATSQSTVAFLTDLCSWFSNKEDSVIAYKILEKSQNLITVKTNVLDIHFLYNLMIKIYYKNREIQEYANKAIVACEKQIQLAPKAAKAFKEKYRDDPLPSHTGYTQLVIILEKQKEYEKVIDLCKQAQAQTWNGDWTKRIERCVKKTTS